MDKIACQIRLKWYSRCRVFCTGEALQMRVFLAALAALALLAGFAKAEELLSENRWEKKIQITYLCTNNLESVQVNKGGRILTERLSMVRCSSLSGEKMHQPIMAFRNYFDGDNLRLINVLSVFICWQTIGKYREKTIWTMKCRFVRSSSQEI